MELFDLNGKVAVITGASVGLGRQFAFALAEQGADIAIIATKEDKLREVAEEITAKTGRKAFPLGCDITDEAQISTAVDKILDEYGKIDILVNNAGVINYCSKYTSYTAEKWDAVIDTNLKGLFLMSREVVARSMMENNYGKIINIASVGGLLGSAGSPGYCAAKGGVVNLTRAMAADLAPYNILVNAIGPGTFETRMTSKILENDFIANNVKGRCPLKRIGRPGELNGALIYFASEACSYTIGQILYIDGGTTSTL